MISAEEEVVTNQPVGNVAVSEGTGVHHCQHCGNPVIAAPALRDAKDGTVVPLRCFVRRTGSGSYLAECIDLDILAEADTLESAIAGLQDAMIGYMYVVFEGQETNAVSSVSILRPSPLSHRIRYFLEYLKYLVAEFVTQAHGRRAEKFYEVPAVSMRTHCGA